MSNPIRRLTFVNHINTVRMALAQIDEMLTGMEEILESDPVPEFDPKKLYRCRDPEFHAAIHYTDREGRHYGCIWQNGAPAFSVSWDLAGKYIGSASHESWDLVNYSTPDLDSSCGE